jgi:hypothetical protein
MVSMGRWAMGDGTVDEGMVESTEEHGEKLA